MTVAAAEPFKVGDWLVDPALLRISKNGEVRKLEFRTMEILLCLVANKGEVVSKRKLHDEVWKEVSKAQDALGAAVGKSVSAPASPSSLQLTLEDPEVRARAADYQNALEPLLAQHKDALGYALAVGFNATPIFFRV